MNELKIIGEETVSFLQEGDIYVMNVRTGTTHHIIIDTRTSRIGRIQANSSREAETMFVHIISRMCSYWEIQPAIKMLELAFSMRTVKEFMFIVNNLNVTVKFIDICRMSRLYGLVTTPINIDIVFEKKEKEYKIFVTFPGHLSPLGFFVAPNDESPFTFHVNEDFI